MSLLLAFLLVLLCWTPSSRDEGTVGAVAGGLTKGVLIGVGTAVGAILVLSMLGG
jgi:hypothetical protein